MKKLHKLLINAYLGPLAITFFISILVLLMQFLWKYIDELVGKGLDWSVILELLFYASATFVPLALPLATLLASLMTFGNMGEYYELVAVKAAGVSLQKIMRPLIIINIMVASVAFYFSNNILPIANLKMGSLLFDVREQKPALNIQEGVFYDDIDNFIIKVGKKHKDGKTLEEIVVYDHSERNGNNNVSFAKKGYIEVTDDEKFMVFTLYDGVNYYEKLNDPVDLKRRPLQRTYFSKDIRTYDLSTFEMSRTSEIFFKDHYKMLTIKQLSHATDSLKLVLDSCHLQISDYIKASLSRYYLVYYDSTNVNQIPTANYNRDDVFTQLEQGNKERLTDNAINISSNFNSYIKAREVETEALENKIIRHVIEYQRKFTLSLACLVLFFIGAPLGAIIRKGGFGLPFVVSTLMFILYHIISMTGEKMARNMVVSPEFGMWLSMMVFLPLGIFLTIKATKDSPIFESEAWAKILKLFSKK